MRIRADLSQPADVTPDAYQWVPSPAAGVERMMLDRMGAESGRATSLVHFASQASFPHHEHPGGEEILVLQGSFNDERGRFPAGFYLRNPSGTSHSPNTDVDTRIFVKLCQIADDDQCTVALDTRRPELWQTGEGHEVCLLHEHRGERVMLLRLESGTAVPAADNGREILVLEGELTEPGNRYPAGSWLRRPAGDHSTLSAADTETLVYFKSGHLLSASEPPAE